MSAVVVVVVVAVALLFVSGATTSTSTKLCNGTRQFQQISDWNYWKTVRRDWQQRIMHKLVGWRHQSTSDKWKKSSELTAAAQRFRTARPSCFESVKTHWRRPSKFASFAGGAGSSVVKSGSSRWPTVGCSGFARFIRVSDKFSSSISPNLFNIFSLVDIAMYAATTASFSSRFTLYRRRTMYGPHWVWVDFFFTWPQCGW